MAALVYRMLQGGDTFIYLTSEPAPSFTLLVSWMKETDIRFNPGFLIRDVCRSWGKFRFHSDRQNVLPRKHDDPSAARQHCAC